MWEVHSGHGSITLLKACVHSQVPEPCTGKYSLAGPGSALSVAAQSIVLHGFWFYLWDILSFPSLFLAIYKYTEMMSSLGAVQLHRPASWLKKHDGLSVILLRWEWKEQDILYTIIQCTPHILYLLKPPTENQFHWLAYGHIEFLLEH